MLEDLNEVEVNIDDEVVTVEDEFDLNAEEGDNAVVALFAIVKA